MKPESSELYADKVILAPMVRIGTLPNRILALRYGADLVYSEEIIDWKFLRSKRVVNEIRGTIDYIDETDDSVFFQTCAEEKGKVILQIGTCDAERALKVAKLTENDVLGIDINMGCPKEFSIKGGMGAALLSQPEKIEAILTTLVKNLSIPVTCKVRVLPTVMETLNLCKMIESTGVAAIAIHGRTRYERPQHENRNDFLKEIAQNLKIPVIANGGSKDIKSYEDIKKFREATGCSSVMIARAAQWNVSIFNPRQIDMNSVIRDFLKLAVEFNLNFMNTKYTIQQMLRDRQANELGKKFLATSTLAEICEIFNLSEYFKLTSLKFNPHLEKRLAESTIEGSELMSKKTKFEAEVVVPDVSFTRGQYKRVNILPKTVLLNFVRKNNLPMPVYTTTNIERKFRASVKLANQSFRTDRWEKNKRAAEQAAALAVLKYYKIQD